MSVLNYGHRRTASAVTLAAEAERDAQRRLKSSRYPALKNVACRMHRGELVLTGEAPSYFHKQLAQEALRTLALRYLISNQITVAPSRKTTWPHSPVRSGDYEV